MWLWTVRTAAIWNIWRWRGRPCSIYLLLGQLMLGCYIAEGWSWAAWISVEVRRLCTLEPYKITFLHKCLVSYYSRHKTLVDGLHWSRCIVYYVDIFWCYFRMSRRQFCDVFLVTYCLCLWCSLWLMNPVSFSVWALCHVIHFTCLGLGFCVHFLACDAFVRTSRHAVAMMFVHLSVWDGHALWSYGAL